MSSKQTGTDQPQDRPPARPHTTVLHKPEPNPQAPTRKKPAVRAEEIEDPNPETVGER
ncbi:hypothetical protein [Methylobacterium nigriterrae]|uniref:hypothetical protein n=1 Tax=Methylobacterium nigriterrae TaxID=3127512 RepID=UPI0030140483